MTVEEIEILVTAKVEEALKEFEKMIPAIKEKMKQVQEAFSKVDTKAMTSKLHQAVNFMKKKMQDLKKSSENNEIAIKVNNKDAQKQISQVQKQIDSLQEKINARQIKLSVINPQIDKIVDDTRKNVTPEGINPNDKAMDMTVDNALKSNKDFTSLNSQAQKLYTEIEMYNKQLSEAKNKMTQLNQETNKTATTQNKLGSFFGAFKQKIEQVKPSISNIKDSFKGLPKITQNITNNIKGMGIGVKNGLGHILKYAMALFSLRSVYSVLSSCAQSWLSSQNAGAKQLSANINYMKYAMGSAFAPVIQYVIGLVYQLMKAIQSVVYALFRVNIFAKASAGAFKSAQKSAKDTSKSLSSVHSEINNVGDKGNSGGGVSSPNFDLSGIDNQMSALSQKLYDFFKPLVDSWNKYGPALVEQIKTTAGQVTGLISAVWGSFEKIITNGTVYSILGNILAIIGNIAEAYSNAWKYEGNGDTIIQTMADMLNSILNTIREITASEGFQKFLNGVSNAFSGILTFIKPVLDDFLSLIKPLSEIALSIAGDILNSIGNALKWIGDNEIAVTILESLAIAIGLVVAGIKLYNFVQSGALVATLKHTAALIAQGIAWVAANWPILLIVAAITAVIAIIILCVKHWDTIKETMIKVATTIKEKVITAFNYMKNKISTIFNTIKTTIVNIWNGIWNGIKNIINKILGGIESFVNGTIKGINKLLSGISKVANAVGSFIGLNPISLQISTISLPRLAKGGVLTEATAVVAGEYSGVKSNPEIVTPQNIMRETIEDVLSDFASLDNSDRPINITINVGNKKLGQILLDDLRDKTRRTGKDIEALIGG